MGRKMSSPIPKLFEIRQDTGFFAASPLGGPLCFLSLFSSDGGKKGNVRMDKRADSCPPEVWLVRCIREGLVMTIRSRDNTPPPEGMCRTNGWASSSPNLRDVGFPPSGSEPLLDSGTSPERVPECRHDSIAVSPVLQASDRSDDGTSLLEDFLRVLLILLANEKRMAGGNSWSSWEIKALNRLQDLRDSFRSVAG